MERDKLEVGEYIRTKTGNITKVCKIKDTVVWTDEFMDIHCRYNEGVVEKADILKHSKNIIDLIEVGDFVGKCEIEYITQNENGETLLMNDNVTLTEKDIDTIVTKEQFKEMEYRV